MDQEKMGKFIKTLRHEKNLTQEQFAEKMNVSRRTVSRWETGNNIPDLDLLMNIADYFGVDLRELINGERKVKKMNNELKETQEIVTGADTEKNIMKTNYIIAKVKEDGTLINNANFLDEFSFNAEINFTKDGIVISMQRPYLVQDSSNSKMIPYRKIQKMNLYVIRRADGGKAHSYKLFDVYYNYELQIFTEENIWQVECSASYALIQLLKKTNAAAIKINDPIGILNLYDNQEQFYDLSNDEIKHMSSVRRRDIKKNDFQKYCDEHYGEWMKKYKFDNIRFRYSNFSNIKIA